VRYSGWRAGDGEVNGEADFVRSLADFLALHTEQSSRYLRALIQSFLRGAHGQPTFEPVAKDEIRTRLSAEMEAHNNVPSFLENYLLTRLKQDTWPPQASLMATLYLRRQAGERFVTWQRRQQLVAEMGEELIRGTELGFRQLHYGQGAGTVFRWRGVPCFKTNCDLAIYTMLIDELKPGTIIELGSGTGGSALLFADLCASMGLATQVISIDRAAAEISDPRITFVQSDCSTWLEATAKSKPDFPRPYLLVEDFHGDLPGCFEYIDLILQVGDYLVIEDSSSKQKQVSVVSAGRPYFVDSKYTDFFGTNCTTAVNSIFVKDTDTSAPRSRARQERQALRNQDRLWRQRNNR
jgi:cephalosporin hydroxylase